MGGRRRKRVDPGEAQAEAIRQRRVARRTGHPPPPQDPQTVAMRARRAFHQAVDEQAERLFTSINRAIELSGAPDAVVVYVLDMALQSAIEASWKRVLAGTGGEE